MMWLAFLRNLYVRRKIEEATLTSAVTKRMITEVQKSEIMQAERIAEDA